MMTFNQVKKSALIGLWFIFLTFPIMVIKADPFNDTVDWRWMNMVYVGVGSFLLSLAYQFIASHKERINANQDGSSTSKLSVLSGLQNPDTQWRLLIGLLAVALIFPQVFSSYQTTIMTNALMYVMLGLGLNIVVGIAGLLDLGYVAFYAVGAYAYALLNLHFDIGFWMALPIGAALAALLGLLLGFPVLRLRGDYLAIVTLGFGEIIRLILENWNEFSKGPSGIANIPRPGFFGMEMSLEGSIQYIYYLMIVMVIITIFIVNRLQDSRIGRAWLALREDEIACQAMGIDRTKTKLMAFALGATWAGFAGVIFAAKTTFINPASFTFLESAIILSIVVLGGMGSILGVIIGALVLILLPEYLRALSEYRMLAFGAILVTMMVFRPQGFIGRVRRTYKIEEQGGSS